MPLPATPEPGTFRDNPNPNHLQPDETPPSGLPDRISEAEDQITAHQDTATMENPPVAQAPAPTAPKPGKGSHASQGSHKKLSAAEKARRQAARNLAKTARATAAPKLVKPKAAKKVKEEVSLSRKILLGRLEQARVNREAAEKELALLEKEERSEEESLSTTEPDTGLPLTEEAPASVAAPGEPRLTGRPMTKFERDVENLFAATVAYMRRTNMMKVFRVATSPNAASWIRFSRVLRDSVAAFEMIYLGTPEDPGLIHDEERLHEEVVRLLVHSNAIVKPERMAIGFALICGFRAWTMLPLPEETD